MRVGIAARQEQRAGRHTGKAVAELPGRLTATETSGMGIGESEKGTEAEAHSRSHNGDCALLTTGAVGVLISANIALNTGLVDIQGH